MIVADTNLLVYLLLPSQLTERVKDVFSRDDEWAVPLLWASEFRNVLAGYLRRGTIAIDTVRDVVARAEALVHGREHPVGSREVLDLVARSACSAYDCEFVALALRLGVPLVTSDGKVLREFPEVAISLAGYAG